MGIKSRSNYSIKFCVKDCKVKGEKCDICFRYSEYVSNTENKDEEKDKTAD